MGFLSYVSGVVIDRPNKKVGLIQGRHPLPVEGYIIRGDIPPDKMTRAGILSLVDLSICRGQREIALYITGLTIAALTVVDVLRSTGIGVEIRNFDPTTGEYYSQGFFSSTGNLDMETIQEILDGGEISSGQQAFLDAAAQLLDTPKVQTIEDRLEKLVGYPPVLIYGTSYDSDQEKESKKNEFLGFLSTLTDEEISARLRYGSLADWRTK